MTVQTIIDEMKLTPFHLADGARPVTAGYCGDLLSWVMGKAPESGAWMTIMSNVNVAAVAALTDVACVILTEGVVPDEPLLLRAEMQGINLLGTPLPTFRCAVTLAALLE